MKLLLSTTGLLSIALSASPIQEYGLSKMADAPTITLKNALALAKENNLNLKKVANQVSIAEGTVFQSFSPLLPQLSLNASHQRNLAGQLAGDGASAGLRLNTALLDIKSMVAMKGQKKALASAKLSYEHEANRTGLDVANAYVEALMAQSLRLIALEELEQFKQQLEVLKKRLELGIARPLDVSRGEYLLNKSQSDLVLKEREFGAKLAVLGAVINRREAFLVEDFELSSPYFTEETEVLMALAQNSADIRALKKDYSSHTYSLYSEGFDFLPKLSARLDTGWRYPYESQAVLGRPNPFAEIMFNLELPLFSGGSSLAAIKKKTAARSTVDLSLRMANLDKHLSINGTLEQISAYQMSLLSAELALNAAIKSKESTDRLFKFGEATALDLTQANVDLVNAKTLAANTKLRLVKNKINLLFLIGKMSEIE